MTGRGRRISSPEDFPNVAVYENGPVISVVFKNRESIAGMNARAWAGLLAVMAVMLLGWPVLEGLRQGFNASGAAIAWYWPLLGWAVAFGLTTLWAVSPEDRERAIVLDAAKNQLRVYKGGRITVTQPLDKLYTFTIDKHPQAETERLRNPGAVGQFQKQHCLYGRFGPGGAYDVNLVCRWEWPSRNSLYEVRQALEWILEGAPGALLSDEARRKLPSGGLRPPLE